MSGVLKRACRVSDRKQVRGRRTEQQILDAALRIFGRDGISRSRIGDIADEAGISASTLYGYYGSKEDIAYAVPRAYLAKFYEEFAGVVADTEDAKDRIRIYLSLIADFVRRNPQWARLFYLEIWPSVLVGDTPLSESVDDFSRILIFLVGQAIDDGHWSETIDVYETAALLIGSLNHVITTWLLFRRPKNITKAGAGIVEHTLALLDAESEDLKKIIAPENSAHTNKYSEIFCK